LGFLSGESAQAAENAVVVLPIMKERVVGIALQRVLPTAFQHSEFGDGNLGLGMSGKQAQGVE
jgi:hypothetical protein